jgi:hypothetical protein
LTPARVVPGIERTRHARVVHDAEKQTDITRPHERAACRARLDCAYTPAAHDADGRRAKEDAVSENTTDKDRSRPHRKSADHASELAAEAAAGPEGLMPRRL